MHFKNSSKSKICETPAGFELVTCRSVVDALNQPCILGYAVGHHDSERKGVSKYS